MPKSHLLSLERISFSPSKHSEDQRWWHQFFFVFSNFPFKFCFERFSSWPKSCCWLFLGRTRLDYSFELQRDYVSSTCCPTKANEKNKELEWRMWNKEFAYVIRKAKGTHSHRAIGFDHSFIPSPAAAKLSIIQLFSDCSAPHLSAILFSYFPLEARALCAMNRNWHLTRFIRPKSLVSLSFREMRNTFQSTERLIRSALSDSGRRASFSNHCQIPREHEGDVDKRRERFPLLPVHSLVSDSSRLKAGDVRKANSLR